MLVRQILTSTMISHDYSSDQWLNHNEIVTDPITNLSILSSLLVNSNSTEIIEPPSKRSRNVIIPADHVREQRLTSTLFGSLYSNNNNNKISINTSSDISDNEILLKRLVKAMTSRDTIDLIYNKLFSI
jgi:hypothetical protein